MSAPVEAGQRRPAGWRPRRPYVALYGAVLVALQKEAPPSPKRRPVTPQACRVRSAHLWCDGRDGAARRPAALIPGLSHSGTATHEEPRP